MPWEKRYRAIVATGDVLIATSTVGLVYLTLRHQPNGMISMGLTASAVLIVLVIALFHSWDHRVLGQGAEEFRLLGRAGFVTAVILAFGGLATGATAVRLWVFAVIPAMTALCMCHRYVLRKVLHRKRLAGQCLLPVIAAGAPEALTELIERTRTESHVGWDIQAVCTTSDTGPKEPGGDVASVPVVGGLEDLVDRVRHGGYRVVAISASSYWTRQRLQHLAWQLEDTATELVLAPVLMDVTGPRVHVSEVLGMPLLRVSAPMFTGPRLLVKSVADRVGALFILLVLAPVMCAVAAAIRLDSRGPVMYRQHRVGRDGEEFTMLKFRTMVVGAHRMLSVRNGHNEGAGPLFKSRVDPRVTQVGTLLRRYSLDELPQLFNVLSGNMSLVGPRPPLPEEMVEYAPEVFRKFRVTPGMTGLWQVSGRSELSWAESVRLDLRYVENWSLALDATIMWKTVRAVISKRGAY